MTVEQKRFFLVAAAILSVTIFASQAVFSAFFETILFNIRITSIVFVWLATCVSHFLVMKAVTDTPSAFNRVFMTQTMLKLFMYMAFIGIYLVITKGNENALPFTLHFFCIYIVFAIFEVTMILKFVKDNSGRKTDNVKK